MSEVELEPGGLPPATTLAATLGVSLPGAGVGSTLTTRVAGGTPPGSRPTSDTSNHRVGGIGGRCAVSLIDTRRGGRAIVSEQLSIRIRQSELNEIPSRWQR